MGYSRRILVAILVLAVGSGIAIAQTETGQITGTVFDSSGAAVPNATVTAVDTATKAARSTTASSGGVYEFPNLLPGRYEVTTEAKGFQKTVHVVTVTVGARVGFDFHLTVGSQQETIVVQENLTAVNTETQTLGENISSSEVLNLPTLTRNPYDLVKTVGNTTSADPTTLTRGVGVSINGLRASDVGVLLDGVPNNNNFDTTVAIQTPLDSVGEFTVLTSNFTAEFGRAIAGVVNVDTKRGSNAFHGTAYEFNRVSALASNTFDNNANNIDKPVFVRNEFGFSVGGPIVPDKLFFFVNPEWTRVRSSAIQTAAIATPQLIAASATNTQQFFSTYGTLRPGLTVLQSFTRGQICTSGACTAIPSTTPIYEKVSYSVPADSGGGSPQNELNLAGRVDYNASDKTQIYFRYALVDRNYFNGTVDTSPYVGYDTGENDMKNAFAFSVTHAFSAHFISQTKLSYNRNNILQPLGAAPIGPTLYTTYSSTSSLGNAAIVYPGYSAYTPGNSIPFGGPQNFSQLNEDLTKTFSKHSLRFGGLITYLQDDRTFAAYQTAVAGLGTNQSSAVNGLVTGQLSQFEVAVYPQGEYPCINGPSGQIVTAACTLKLPLGPPNFSRSNAVHEDALYVQDSWKIHPHLTLNLGLRWEYFGPQASRNPNLDSNFYAGPGLNLMGQTAGGKAYVSTDPSNPVGGLWKKDWRDFSPRIGFAWDVFGNGKTSLRGGYGMGWEPNFGNVTFNVLFNPPNYGLVTFSRPADLASIPITIQNYGPLSGSSGTKALPRLSLRWVDPYIKTAHAHVWNLALEHQFSNDMIGALEYSGSKGVNLYTINTMNNPGSAAAYGLPGSGSGNPLDRLNPQYSGLNLRTNGGFSNYHSFNGRVEMRNFKHTGVTMRLNYTWSHAIDNISNTFSETATGSGNLGILAPLNPGLDKGSADFDVRHRVTLAGIWDIPYKGSNAITREVLGGWSLTPSLSARTGAPFSIWDCSNAYQICPRVMYDTQFKGHYSVTANGNPNGFNYMSVGTPDSTYANAAAGVSDFGPFPVTMQGRNTFRAPGTWGFDMSIHKNFKLTESKSLQFRAEMYNAFNHSNLFVVYSNTDVSATSYITATRGLRGDNNAVTSVENRNVQLALKLIF